MMRASLRKALADYNLYLKKLGIDKIKKRKKKGTFVFEDCGNRNGVPTGDKIPVFSGGKKQEFTYSGERKLIGIGLLHKSNLVPVWDEQDAKEISKMRRG
jgi:hypothetical protein|tara:strand:+ start:169 stop:468 length:300 start_codon:yes stop_codon:yes gene_type:complete